MTEQQFGADQSAGRRFGFGRNWQSFLSAIDEERVAEAEGSLKRMLGVETLEGRSFLDVGSGSGLFSLAAARLGAKPIHSFDYDSDSVACTQELKRRLGYDVEGWTVERGDVLDDSYVCALGQWDVVYAWGVLHHTGAMRRAMQNAASLVRGGGVLFVSIYNDQGVVSAYWCAVKRLYNWGVSLRWVVRAALLPYLLVWVIAGSTLRGERSGAHKCARGMSRTHDWLDWLGGYPFEVAKPEDVFQFYRERGFQLLGLKTCGGRHGCNEFVFRK